MSKELIPSLNPVDLSGRRFLVTGASSGIGRATAILLSQLGATVVLVARNQERLQNCMQMLEGKGHAAEVFDLSNYEQIPIWMRELSGKHGFFDGLVHCAGIYALAPLRVLELSQTESLWRLNVFSHLWLAKGYRQNRVRNGGGSIVLISSAVGLVGQPALSVYSATKGAVISMMRSLAVEFARDKIRVNCIAPGNLKTGMTQAGEAAAIGIDLTTVEKDHPLGFGDPEDVAYAAAYLLSPAAKWITGTTLVVDGGYTAH